MSDRCNCDRLCVPTTTATVISATVEGTVATLTINQPLTSLSYFKLNVPCAIISGLANVDTVSFTDGTDTYIGYAFNGELLTISTLKRKFCKRACCCDCCRCDDFLIAYSSQSQTTVTILNRIL